MTHAGGGLERRPESLPIRPSDKVAERSPETLSERRTEVSERLPVPYRTERGGDAANIMGWPEFASWVHRRGVVLFGIVLIAAQLIWRSLFLSHYFFWQDDFHFLDGALSHSFTWSYLSQVAAGHWFPGVYAISWVVARAGLYDWGFASTITVVMLAAANLAALRLLRTLFGDRPAILVPLLIYLLCPLSVMDIRFWAAAIELWPLVIAIFMALTAQVHYVRTRRFRHAVAAAAWLAVGLIFNEKALVLPLLLFAITSAFLMEGPWRRTIRECLVKYWRAWLLQAVLLACYATAFVWSLSKSPAKPSVPGTASAVLSFTEELVKDTFVPGAIGGPWQWSGSPDAQMASAATPNALAWLGRDRPARGNDPRSARAADPLCGRRGSDPGHMRGPGVPAAGRPTGRQEAHGGPGREPGQPGGTLGRGRPGRRVHHRFGVVGPGPAEHDLGPGEPALYRERRGGGGRGAGRDGDCRLAGA